MEQKQAMKMRVFFLVETMEQLAVVWAMAKQTGLQPDIVPDMPVRQKVKVDREELITLGRGTPPSKTPASAKAWKAVTALLKSGKTARGDIEDLVSKTRHDGSGPRLVGLWIKTGYLNREG